MEKLFFLLAACMLGLTACSNKLTVDKVESTVLQGEREGLPLLKQNLSFIVDDITIDSLHITVEEEPMQGYLYTTWITTGKRRKETPIIVMVDSIRSDDSRKGYIRWKSRWDDAAKSYILNRLKF